MFYFDLLKLGIENLLRSRVRTILTILGVVIGIGALTSMISFGTGMEKNVTDAFKKNEIFTTLIVTSSPLNMGPGGAGGMEKETDAGDSSVVLSDSVLSDIRHIRDVIYAYPEITFPIRIEMGRNNHTTTVQALPAVMGKFKPYNELLGGSFYSNDSANSVVVRWESLRDMKIIVADKDNPYTLTKKDSVSGFRVLPADSLIGKTLTLISANIDPSKIMANPIAALSNLGKNLPFSETKTELTLCGILKRSNTFSPMVFKGGIMVPPVTASKIPQLGFTSVLDLLNSKKKQDQYSAIHVRVKSIDCIDPVRKALKSRGLQVFAIVDELDQMKRGFRMLDMILSAIGTIALVVASLGIINTMLMSILERTREIGIMKAIGGSEKDIRLIFFTEAAVIGFLGAVFGLLLGWLVTRLANLIANSSLIPNNEMKVNLFYFPEWLILGAIAFSVLISLAAGLYPAFRAARIDPVKALRHD